MSLATYSRLKFILEPICAVFLVILLTPVLFLIALAIKLSSKGPVFYAQTRTGYMGEQFTLYKFRSMRVNSELNGPEWSDGVNDQRITFVGRFLRRSRLDELPQLYNVIKGEMSFCGPRPERPEIYARLADSIPFFALRTVVRPGITGWAQTCVGYAASVEESRRKLEYDLYYIDNISVRLDLMILLLTVKVVVLGLFERKPRPIQRPKLSLVQVGLSKAA